jgi:hypothetical protein
MIGRPVREPLTGVPGFGALGALGGVTLRFVFRSGTVALR